MEVNAALHCCLDNKVLAFTAGACKANVLPTFMHCSLYMVPRIVSALLQCCFIYMKQLRYISALWLPVFLRMETLKQAALLLRCLQLPTFWPTEACTSEEVVPICCNHVILPTSCDHVQTRQGHQWGPLFGRHSCFSSPFARSCLILFGSIYQSSL